MLKHSILLYNYKVSRVFEINIVSKTINMVKLFKKFEQNPKNFFTVRTTKYLTRKKMLFIRLISATVIAILLLLIILVRSEETLMSGTLRVIFSKIFKPNAMSVSIICNISGHEHNKFSQEVLDKVMGINKNIQIPVAINQYTR